MTTFIFSDYLYRPVSSTRIIKEAFLLFQFIVGGGKLPNFVFWQSEFQTNNGQNFLFGTLLI